MKIFNKVEFVNFVRNNDELYLSNVEVDGYTCDKCLKEYI